ncbi:MAG: aldo/keto reductase [Solobacterium sp.]|nr:aldo/keto reductase [Solobacterium sp.]
MKYLNDGTMNISMLGLGTTGFWSGPHEGVSQCIREARDRYGINLFDTAEMYGNGRCESELGHTLEGYERSQLFLVNKIHPDHATPKDFSRCLEESLIRLGTDYFDLYLLHWREKTELSFLVPAMQEAVRQGKIRHWGVSNFDTQDLEDLMEAGGSDCWCNQIFYTLYERGAEYELRPYMNAHGILPMSYSSLGSGYCPHPDIRKNREIMDACGAFGIAPEAMMLRMNNEYGFAALFSTSSIDHLHADLAEVSDEAYRSLRPVFDRAFPSPDHRWPLVKI